MGPGGAGRGRVDKLTGVSWGQWEESTSTLICDLPLLSICGMSFDSHTPAGTRGGQETNTTKTQRKFVMEKKKLIIIGFHAKPCSDSLTVHPVF